MKIFADTRSERGNEKTVRKFSKENDKSRFLLTRNLGSAKAQTCLVALHKPSMQGSHIRENHANEYNYLLKMLVERISWAVRDAPVKQTAPNGKCRLLLSEQQIYPYSEMFSYFEKLRKGAHNCRAEWGCISPDLPDIVKHADEEPIHLGDLAASSFAMAIEPKSFGMTDDRFIRNIAPTIYESGGKRFGMKLFPDKEMKGRVAALQKIM